MKVISFFSFKGGVGRTALLANLGAFWAAQGKVVVLMDLDLTAPGLSYSIPSRILDEKGRGLGMSDMLHTFFHNLKDNSEEIAFISPKLLLRRAELDDPRMKDADGNLFVIQAGDRRFAAEGSIDDSRVKSIFPSIPLKKPTKVETLRQSAFRSLAYYIGKDLREWNVPEGKAKGRFIDYLLIDSRTGFAELVDLSLGYLADKMVIVSSLNEQNLRGLRYTLDALKEKRVLIDNMPVLVTLIFSPLPAGEDESVFKRLQTAHQVVAQTLRITRADQRELSPLSFSLHYTPILAIREALLVLEEPKSLYAKEVKEIAGHLEGEVFKTDIVDEFMQEARRKAMAMMAIASPEKRLEAPGEEAAIPSNPLADLPPWHWPLPEEEQSPEMRKKRLKKLMPENPNIKINRDILANQWSWCVSFSIDEKRKLMKLTALLKERQVDELLGVLEEERLGYMNFWIDKPKTRNWVLDTYFEHQRQWAILVLGDESLGNERFLKAVAQDKDIFPLWKELPEYWLLLACNLFVRLKDADTGLAMVEQAVAIAKDDAFVAERLLELIEPDSVPLSMLKIIEHRAKEMSPDELWIDFLLARNLLKRKEPDNDAAKKLLIPLLQHPPENADRCMKIGELILYDLSEIAVQAEAVIRKAVDLKPLSATVWYNLGNLLQDHLNRYDEAEAAYRKAIKLDEKFASPWNNLGNLLQNHLNRYDEAEAAYRKAIELDEKFASPWNNLGNLLKNHLNRYDEAEAAYRKAIELNEKYASPWNGLGLLRLYAYNDCTGAKDAFEHGLKLDAASTTNYFNMNMGHLHLLMGDRDRSLDYLKKALHGFERQAGYNSNLLQIAMELEDAESIERYIPLARKARANGDYDSALLLLIHALIHSPESVEESKKMAWDLMDSYAAHFDLVKILYYVSGFCPDASKKVSPLVAELLRFLEKLTAGFKDMPKPDSWCERYRPFAEGRSSGAGDPADLHLFCRKQ